MLETMFETSQKNCKRRDSETMTLLQLSSECPLLFVETPENSLDSVRLTERHRHSCGHEVKRRKKTKAQPKQMAEEQENVERKEKKKKGKRDVSDGAEMQEVPKVETAEQEQEVSQDREQAQGQETERKKKKRDKKQCEQPAEDFSVPVEVEGKQKKKKKKKWQCEEPNSVEAFEQEEQIPQEKKRRKKKRTSCTNQSELSVQDDITAGITNGAEASMQEEKVMEQIPQERERRTSCSDQNDISVQDEITAAVDDGAESSKQEETITEQIPQERKKKKKRKTNCSDQTDLIVQDDITAGIEDGAESSKQEETITEQIPQERKKKKKRRTSCSDQTDLIVQDEITVGVKDCEVQTLIWKEELHELTLDLEGWNTDKLKYIDELREFIPDVEKKTEHAVYRLVKYDLPRFKEFKKAGARIKHGRYSKKELERLRKNVEDFLALTGIDSSTKLFFPARYPNEKAHIIKLKNLHRFHLRMSAGICRPWHDIYHKGRKVFDFSSKGRFTEEEVHSLEKLHQLHGNNWMKLAELTGRSSYALEKRFSQQSQNKGSWTKTEQQALESALREHMVGLVEPGSQGPTIRRDQLYSKLPWTEVARKVGTRSWDQCRLKWMSLLKKKMAAGTPVLGGQKSREANIRLIKALYAMEVEDVAHVNWEDLTQEMGDVPPHYVQTRFYRMKVNWVPLWQSMSFGDVINFLHERILPQLEQKLRITTGKPTAGMEEAGTQQERFLFSEIFSDLMTTGEGSEEEEGGETVNF